jgi:hypothetical protein
VTDDAQPGRTALPSLPADRTFVVQFKVSPGHTSDGLAPGRVEHLLSGLAGRFTTWYELRQFMERALSPEAHSFGGSDPE